MNKVHTMIIKGCIRQIKNKSVEKSIIIFGAGNYGQSLHRMLIEEGLNCRLFFDNNKLLNNTFVMGVEVRTPCRLDYPALYVIAALRAEYRKEMLNDLLNMGVRTEDIEIVYNKRDYEYMYSLEPCLYKDELNDMYEEKFKKSINWKNPATYNEIINWEKLYLNDPMRSMLCDKIAVRPWVAERIGEKYLNHHILVWDDPDEVDLSILPQKYVIKMNNASNRNIVVKNANEIDKEKVITQIKEWYEKDFFYTCLETQYQGVKPKIIVEEYLEGLADEVYDYNIYCFHGKPKFVWCINGSHKDTCKASFYDCDWNMQEFSFGYPLDEIPAPRPKQLELMLELSEVLAEGFEHVRVDWFDLPDGRLFFGEMTFSSHAGMEHFKPEKYDMVFGKLIKCNKQN